MVILSTNENTYNAELKPISAVVPAVEENHGYTPPSTSYTPYRVPSYEDLSIDNLSSSTPNIPKVQYTIGKKVLSLDVETTGLNPWEYKLIVCTVWDLDEPKANMITFAGWDEEQLCYDLFDYIAQKNPDVILAFNAKFEARCFISRAMLYHIQAPWIWSVEWHDLLAMLEGGWKNGLTGTQPSGSEENWLKFFFDETKPYTIEECFEGIRNGRLDEMIIRNRTCVQGQGDMYQLIMYCQSGAGVEIIEEKPTAERRDDVLDEGLLTVKCVVCNAVNEIVTQNNPGQCWRCSANLPVPDKSNVLREIARPVDWSLVGLSGEKLKEAQAAAKKSKSSLALQPVGSGNIAKTAITRLTDLGIAP